MLDWRRIAALVSSVSAFAAPAAHAYVYEFAFEGNSGNTIRFGSTTLATILPGVPTAARGAGDTAAAVETIAGASTVHTLPLDTLTFAGFPLSDRVLQHTVDAAGNATLCMAGTCVALGRAMPASWWDAPVPLDLSVAPDDVRQIDAVLALQPGATAAAGSRTDTIPPTGGTLEYGWLPRSSAAPFGPAPLHVVIGPVPEPGTLVLLGAGLIAAAGTGRRRRAAG